MPELVPGQTFRIARESLFEQIQEAQALGYAVKPVIPGPLTWLYLGKGDAYAEGAADAGKLQLLAALLPVYEEVLARCATLGVQWVQIDEPILALDLPQAWRDAFREAYATLSNNPVKLLVATYFDGLRDNLPTALGLDVAGLHVDLVRAPEQLAEVVSGLRADQVLSAGVINGRNVWRTDLDAAIATLAPIKQQLGDRLWLAPSCSLLHVPVDLAHETELDAELKSWLSFAAQKLDELSLLGRALDNAADASVQAGLAAQRAALASRRSSARIHNPVVGQRMAAAAGVSRDRAPFAGRIASQQAQLGLPAYPTTTIGSFPQTAEIRALRRDWKAGALTDSAYESAIRKEIEEVIRFQEKVGLDVLVHGEAERNDMVEYFGELLAGFAFTKNGWSAKLRLARVKPPGHLRRASPAPMTVGWSSYAQSLTDKPVKGMLTGPVTILQWSFVRDDQPREQTCRQLALALRDEVVDLEAAGIGVIQIDEPAIREGLPLRRADWQAYLDWAVDCFRLSTSAVSDETQIHTHMCYSEFNDIMQSIADMDADVITIETSRSNMERSRPSKTSATRTISVPGCTTSIRRTCPTWTGWSVLMKSATARLPPEERLWVNPDCGLKTPWPETEAALIGIGASGPRAARSRLIPGARSGSSAAPARSAPEGALFF